MPMLFVVAMLSVLPMISIIITGNWLRLLKQYWWIVICLLFMHIITQINPYSRPSAHVLWYYDLIFLDCGYLIVCAKDHIRKGISVLSFVVWLTAVYGILYYLASLSIPGMEWTYEYQTGRLCSVFVNPIPCANVMSIGFWLPEFSNNKRIKWVRRLTYILAIIMTQTRSVLLSLVVSLLVFSVLNWQEVKAWLYSIFSDKFRRYFFALFCVFAIVIGFLSGIFQSLIYRFSLSFDVGNEAVFVRLDYSKYIIQKFMESSIICKIFGHGYCSVRKLMAESTLMTRDLAFPDNMYVTLLYDMGVVSIVLIVIVVVIALKLIVMAHRDCVLRKSIVYKASMAVVAESVAILFTDCFLFQQPTSLIIMCTMIATSGRLFATNSEG